MKVPARLLAAFLFVSSGRTHAHSFGTAYNLPVPFWMYAYGASAALAISFAIVAYFASVPITGDDAGPKQGRRGAQIAPLLIDMGSALSVGLLILNIATGLFGTQNVYENFNMTFFWLLFALGFLYLTALVGDIYEFLSPWRVLCDIVAPITRGKPIFRSYPAGLAYYPALVLYTGFIWFELFGDSEPFSLAVALAVYTAINCIGAILFSRAAWFRYGEFFAVMFHLVGRMAPVAYARQDDHVYVSYRRPLAGLLDGTAQHASLLLFVLFMLSSTAFDGLHDTLPWANFFWQDIFPIVGGNSTQQHYAIAAHSYYYWQWAMLVASPFIYLLVYRGFIVAAKWVAGSHKGVQTLALGFTLSLVPVAFAYNITHYFTLLVSQGLRIVPIISDPFGLQWNLFGTAPWFREPVILDAGTVWHTQVGLILIGHMLGVYVSHIEALRVFKATRRAIVSQLPILLLMIVFTTAGLWILSLPIAGGQVVVPPST